MFPNTDKIIYLMRHGQTHSNLLSGIYDTFDQSGLRRPPQAEYDTRLTLEGTRQAENLAVALSCLEPKPQVLAVSPLTRALQTAELAFSHYPNLKRKVLTRSREKVFNAADTGSDPSKLSEEFPMYDFSHLKPVWWYTGGDGETKAVKEEPYVEFLQRVESTLMWFAESPEGVIAHVGHGCFLRHLTGREWSNCEVHPYKLSNLRVWCYHEQRLWNPWIKQYEPMPHTSLNIRWRGLTMIPSTGRVTPPMLTAADNAAVQHQQQQQQIVEIPGGSPIASKHSASHTVAPAGLAVVEKECGKPPGTNATRTGKLAYNTTNTKNQPDDKLALPNNRAVLPPHINTDRSERQGRSKWDVHANMKGITKISDVVRATHGQRQIKQDVANQMVVAPDRGVGRYAKVHATGAVNGSLKGGEAMAGKAVIVIPRNTDNPKQVLGIEIQCRDSHMIHDSAERAEEVKAAEGFAEGLVAAVAAVAGQHVTASPVSRSALPTEVVTG